MQSVNVVLSLRDRYDSNQMLEFRQRTAATLLKGEDISPVKDEVVVFFETLGFSVKEKTIDNRTVWNHFGWETLRYHRALSKGQQLQKLRTKRKDDLLYINFDWLNQTCQDIDAKARRNSPLPEITDDDIRQFLESESRHL